MADGLYFGLMSGTSMDGVDGVAARFENGARPGVLAEAFTDFPANLREALFALQNPGSDEIEREALAANALSACYARCCRILLDELGMNARAVRAIGVHGQTVRHRPELGYTRQTNNPALLAELTDIDVIADFRSRDVAAHGQGAPLAPALHAALFSEPGETRVVCNLGGIANITVRSADGSVIGFDCGPANALLDYWAQRNLGRPYDDDGRFAASGTADSTLLRALLSERYFDMAPPKSTGRDLFNPSWLEARLMQRPGLAPRDVQATLLALTATRVARDIARHGATCRKLMVCGGGARNGALRACLQRALHAQGVTAQVESTAALGVPPHQVEALAFAWLARCFTARQPGNLPSVTGANGPRILGALYPAG